MKDTLLPTFSYTLDGFIAAKEFLTEEGKIDQVPVGKAIWPSFALIEYANDLKEGKEK